VAWKGVHLSRPARLSHAEGQLVVAQDDGTVKLPLEDVAWIIVDTPQATLTSALLSACMEAGIAVIATDARHHPCGMVLPFHRHHRQAAVAGLQLETGLPLKKRLWQAIVRAKIENQAAALDACGRAGGEALRAMARLVGSGDPDNVEARAARDYWSRLFDHFVRGDAADRRNGLLDYGYAVIRAALARALVACGLLPCIGLQHARASNAFNLADDLLEPFRPFVDRLASTLADGTGGADGPAEAFVSLQDRRTLAGILTADARVGAEHVSLLVAAETAAASLVRAFEARSPAPILLPRLDAEA
jgi:CRISP-associated protein Cas1